jgi:hypothetical protein
MKSNRWPFNHFVDFAVYDSKTDRNYMQQSEIKKQIIEKPSIPNCINRNGKLFGRLEEL